MPRKATNQPETAGQQPLLSDSPTANPAPNAPDDPIQPPTVEPAPTPEPSLAVVQLAPAGPESTEPWQPSAPLPAGMLSGVTPGLLKAVAQVMQRLQTLAFDARNKHGDFGYASIDAYMAALRPALAEAGLVIIQDLESQQVVNGLLTSQWQFFVLHVGGGVLGPVRFDSAAPANMGAQAFGGVQAYGLKFFLRSLFMVAANEKGEDIDQQPSTKLKDGDTRPAPRNATHGNARPAQAAPAPRAATTAAPAGNGQQQAPAPAQRTFATSLDKLKDRLRAAGVPFSSVARYFAVNDISELSERQITEAGQHLAEAHEKPKGINPDQAPADQ